MKQHLFFSALLAVVFLANIGLAQTIIEIHTKTGTFNPMEEGFGRIGVSITNNVPQTCTVTNLDEDGDTFLRGAIDAFYGVQIGGCLNFPAPLNEIPSLTVYHHDVDDLELEWIRVVFSDQTFVQCYAGNMILAGETSLTLTNCI